MNPPFVFVFFFFSVLDIPLRYSNSSSSEAGFAAKLESEPQSQGDP